ncbi:MAG: hypothetical protein JRC87_00375 [Deltaproteobacteria bacterium]|nr:hypothetical protein [Deltaproteobacteria bacterium]MBW2658045.1 hypothetical protein [Deltaproteobacteria bacterium]
MEKKFHDILHTEDVHGLVLLSVEGEVLFKSFKVGHSPERDRLSWKMIIASLTDFDEMNLVYDRGRLYIRNTGNGYLIVSMDIEAKIALVKLSCDIVMPELKKGKRSKGFKRFFGKK